MKSDPTLENQFLAWMETASANGNRVTLTLNYSPVAHAVKSEAHGAMVVNRKGGLLDFIRSCVELDWPSQTLEAIAECRSQLQPGASLLHSLHEQVTTLIDATQEFERLHPANTPATDVQVSVPEMPLADLCAGRRAAI